MIELLEKLSEETGIYAFDSAEDLEERLYELALRAARAMSIDFESMAEGVCLISQSDGEARPHTRMMRRIWFETDDGATVAEAAIRGVEEYWKAKSELPTERSD